MPVPYLPADPTTDDIVHAYDTSDYHQQRSRGRGGPGSSRYSARWALKLNVDFSEIRDRHSSDPIRLVRFERFFILLHPLLVNQYLKTHLPVCPPSDPRGPPPPPPGPARDPAQSPERGLTAGTGTPKGCTRFGTKFYTENQWKSNLKLAIFQSSSSASSGGGNSSGKQLILGWFRRVPNAAVRMGRRLSDASRKRKISRHFYIQCCPLSFPPFPSPSFSSYNIAEEKRTKTV